MLGHSSENKNATQFHINFTSGVYWRSYGAAELPKTMDISDGVNPWVKQIFSNRSDLQAGLVMMDFVDRELVSAIIEHNFKDPVSHLDFSLAEEFAKGDQVSVAMSSAGYATVLMVANSDKVYSRLGKVDQIIKNKSDQFAKGDQASVAMSRDYVVAAIVANSDRVYSRLGKASGSEVAWLKESKQFAKGDRVSVAMGGNDVVAAIVANSDKVYSRLGEVDGNEVSWLKESEQFAKGDQVSVAMSGNVVVAAIVANSDKVYCRLGEKNGSKIAWGRETAEHFARGDQVSVAMDDSGNVVAFIAASGKLWYRVGKLQNTSITWGEQMPHFAEGHRISGAMNRHKKALTLYRKGDALYCKQADLNLV